jgi:hypothetical protein
MVKAQQQAPEWVGVGGHEVIRSGLLSVNKLHVAPFIGVGLNRSGRDRRPQLLTTDCRTGSEIEAVIRRRDHEVPLRS